MAEVTFVGPARPVVAVSACARRLALRGGNAARGAALPCMCVCAHGSLMRVGHAISKRKVVQHTLTKIVNGLVLLCWELRGALARGDLCKRRALRRVARMGTRSGLRPLPGGRLAKSDM